MSVFLIFLFFIWLGILCCIIDSLFHIGADAAVGASFVVSGLIFFVIKVIRAYLRINKIHRAASIVLSLLKGRNINKIEIFCGRQVSFDGVQAVDLNNYGYNDVDIREIACKVNDLLGKKYAINDFGRWYEYKGEMDYVIEGYRLDKEMSTNYSIQKQWESDKFVMYAKLTGLLGISMGLLCWAIKIIIG